MASVGTLWIACQQLALSIEVFELGKAYTLLALIPAHCRIEVSVNFTMAVIVIDGNGISTKWLFFPV